MKKILVVLSLCFLTLGVWGQLVIELTDQYVHQIGDGHVIDLGVAIQRDTISFNLLMEGHSLLTGELDNDLIGLVKAYKVYNSAIGGAVIADCSSRASVIDSKLVTETNKLKNLLVLWIGVNEVSDIVGSGTTAYNSLKTYVQNRVIAGWKVLVYTMTPVVSGGSRTAQFEIERDTFNGLLRNDLSLINHTYIIDTDPVTQLSDPDDTEYYIDGTHLTPSGYYLCSQLFTDKVTQLYNINSLFGDNTSTTLVLTSTGNGTGVSTMTLTSIEDVTLTLDGNGKFYTNAAGDQGESTSIQLLAGIPKTFYIKCVSGSSNLVIPQNSITNWANWTSSTNAVSIGGSIASMTNLNYLYILGSNTLSGDVSGFNKTTYLNVRGTNILSGDISKLLSLSVISILGSNTLSGSVALLPSITYLDIEGSNTISGAITNLVYLTDILALGSNTLSGSVAALTVLRYLNAGGSSNFTGSIAALTLLTYLSAEGTNSLSGSIAALTSLTYVSIAGSNSISGDISGLTLLQYAYLRGSCVCTIPNVTDIKGLCYIYVGTAITLTSANVNQILADFWLNKDEAKARANRTIDIRGNAASGAPTGQGITDKGALQAYRSPNPPGTAALWTVTTR